MAGNLRCRVSIQQRTGGRDDWGQPLPDAWKCVAMVWADIRHLSGTESIKAGAVVSTVQASIRIRYRKDVNAGHRVVHEAKTYEIQAVLPDGRRRFVDLLVKMHS